MSECCQTCINTLHTAKVFCRAAAEVADELREHCVRTGDTQGATIAEKYHRLLSEGWKETGWRLSVITEAGRN